ncbi:MAG TPA: hypothetical protein VFJ43_14725, partial [Bacteroidia bacterium]|nr:hypothetical protein [Bacteroidia bacterium]
MTNTSSNCDNRPAEPSGSVCNPQTNCLIEFDGYWWWTNYPFNISNTGYWFNGQQWDPRLASVDSHGLHLKMQQTLLPGAPGAQWSSIEVVLWGKSSHPNKPGQAPPRFYPGFGTYLVAASTAGSFNSLANNCCFGAFTYRFDADPSQTNQHHELDMIEASRWGNMGDPTNAQFTLQPWQPQGNVHRITLQDSGNITIVMNWPSAASPVTYSVYYGIYDLSSLPSKPNITWTTAPSQNIYIPNNACQTVHLNL